MNDSKKKEKKAVTTSEKKPNLSVKDSEKMLDSLKNFTSLLPMGYYLAEVKTATKRPN